MKKYLLLFLTLSCNIIAMDNEPLHNKPVQPVVQKNDECFVCLEGVEEIEKKHGAHHLRVTDCCNQFLCGECLKKTVAQQIKDHGYLQCPYCRRKNLKVLLAKKEEPKQKLEKPLSNRTVNNQPKKEKLHNHPQPNTKLSNQQYEPIDRYILFKQNPPAYLTSSISAEDKLCRAILNDSAEEVRFAVEQGANINRDYCGHFGRKSPLAVAVSLAKSNAVEALLECGAKNKTCSGPTLVSHPHNKNINLLQHALLLGDIKSALALLRYKTCNIQYQKSNIDWLKNPYLKKIIKPVLNNLDQVPNLCLDFMQELINQGYKINNSRGPANIWSVLTECNIQKINLLLDLLQQNNLEIPEYIYPHQSQVTTPLIMAIRHNKNKLIKFLCNARVNVNKTQHKTQLSPLFIAIKINNINAVKYLCKAGANINQQCPVYKHSSLSYAQSIKSTHPKIIQLLKDQGAQVPNLPPCAYIQTFKPFSRRKNTAVVKFNRPITRIISNLFCRLFLKKEGKNVKYRNLQNLIRHEIHVDTFMNQSELQKIIDQVNNSL